MRGPDWCDYALSKFLLTPCAMASIAGLYGNFTSQEDGGGGRTIFLRGLRIPVGDKKSDKKNSQTPGCQPDAQQGTRGNDEYERKLFNLYLLVNLGVHLHHNVMARSDLRKSHEFTQ